MACPAGAPSYQLTCLNLRILKKLPDLSTVQCDREGQMKEENFKYDLKHFFTTRQLFETWELGESGVQGC